jgi:hypothetical protein
MFSKNRAPQLDLFLRSLVHNWDGYKQINIVYTYTDIEYMKGYDKLITKYSSYNIKQIISVSFFKEENFKNDILKMIDPTLPYFVFFSDDDVFINKFSEKDDVFKQFETDKNILCLSLRLGLHINYCYTARLNSPVPKIHNNTWFWKPERGDWAYPMSATSHVFRTSEILPLLKEYSYYSPNTLEGKLAAKPIDKPLMLCYPVAKTFNIPANRVQTDNSNYCMNMDVAEFNKKYLEGKIINYETIKGIVPESCHKEVNLEFINEKII